MADNNSKTTLSERFHNNPFIQGWLCILLALLFGAMLAGVQAALGPVIADNKINETKERVPELLLAQKESQSTEDPAEHLTITQRAVSLDKQGTLKSYTVFEARHPDGRLAGWVTKADGQGYADRIELLLGLDPQAQKITGIFILDQKETPGLGNKIVNAQWRNQFSQKQTDTPLKVVKTGADATDEIDAVTGATISSDSVVAIINRAVSDLKQPLAAVARD